MFVVGVGEPMDILPLLEELRLIARDGVRFSDAPADEERYERVLELVEQCYGETFGLPPEQVRDRLRDSFGYVLGAAVAVFDAEGRILLMKRADNGSWCLPGGHVEPHESPADAAVREAHEETGLKVQINDLVHANYIDAGDRANAHKHVHFVYLAERVGGTLEVSGEGETLGYRLVEDVPEWHPYHDEYASEARGEWSENAR